MATSPQPVRLEALPLRNMRRPVVPHALRLLLVVAAGVLAFDSVTKMIASALLNRLPDHTLDLVPGFLRLSLMGNQGDVMGGLMSMSGIDGGGAGFGALQTQAARHAALWVVVALLGFAYYYLLPHDNRFLMACVGLQLGGGLGNLSDRLQHLYITDFIGVGLGRMTEPWFIVFNFADVCVFAGISLLALYLLQPGATRIALGCRLGGSLRSTHALTPSDPMGSSAIRAS